MYSTSLDMQENATIRARSLCVCERERERESNDGCLTVEVFHSSNFDGRSPAMIITLYYVYCFDGRPSTRTGIVSQLPLTSFNSLLNQSTELLSGFHAWPWLKKLADAFWRELLLPPSIR